jgi:hypothetical protein
MMHAVGRCAGGYSPDRAAPPVQGRQHPDRALRRLTTKVSLASVKSRNSGKSVEAGDPLIAP